MDSVLESLLRTSSTGTASNLFQWDSHRATYRWAGTLAHQERAKSYLDTIKQLKSLGTLSSSAAARNVPSFAEWSGSERISGLSGPASESILRPFLEVGTMVRRLQERIGQALQEDHRAGTTEVRALIRSVEVVLTWVVGNQLRRSSSPLFSSNESTTSTTTSKPGVLCHSRDVSQYSALLLALCRLLDCAPPRSPPFESSFDPTNATKVLNHV